MRDLSECQCISPSAEHARRSYQASELMLQERGVRGPRAVSYLDNKNQAGVPPSGGFNRSRTARGPAPVPGPQLSRPANGSMRPDNRKL